MAPAKRRRPDVDHCIHNLLELQGSSTNQPLKQLGEIFVSGVGLLYHVKIDQATISQIRHQNEGKESVPYPKPNAIPAISSIVHNQALFRALVSCLSASASDIEAAEGQVRMQPGTRKRTAPIDNSGSSGESHASKSLKMALSPQVTKRSTPYAKPQLNVKILAATLLYTAFEHLDHWPVPLVKAYAEDCFGPRSWVDEPACQLLVQNLALCHTVVDEGDDVMLDTNTDEDASVVASFYQQAKKAVVSGHSRPPVARQGSFSSVASHNSSGIRQLGRPRSMSTDSSVGNNSSLQPNASQTPQRRGSERNENDESDSGDEDEVAIATSTSKAIENGDDDSSSGEEDEEVVLPPKTLNGTGGTSEIPSMANDEAPPTLQLSYPVIQKNLKFSRVRQRYFGSNHELAHTAIASALSERLDIKAKQNSGLLQTLPHFTAIPPVRRLITAHLEKWLQSPALAGLARSLFAQTVSMMKNVDPPLPSDLDSIDNILSMRLKANQLNAHVDNVTAIAKRIPTITASRHIFKRLFGEILVGLDNMGGSASDYLKMIHAVLGVLDPVMAADGMAAAIMALLIRRPESMNPLAPEQYVRQLCRLIRLVAQELGSDFNGCRLLESILYYKVDNNVPWGVTEEENRGRLMFQCVTLVVRDLEQRQAGQKTALQHLPESSMAALRQKLAHARKLLLRWCCIDYASFCSPDLYLTDPTRNGKRAIDIIGAGPADYSSILDGLRKNNPKWLNVIRTVLFLEDSGSSVLHDFIAPSNQHFQSDHDWQDEAARVDFCCEYGADVDDEMIRIVLQAAGGARATPVEVAVPILEHLFNGCNKNRKAALHLTDPTLLWDLYKMVEYIPRNAVVHSVSESTDGATEAPLRSGRSKHVNEIKEEDLKEPRMQRLAFPGMWWRVTGLALVMCGASPEHIGSRAWQEHPTLRALIKMVTSDRYRFPTVDCDDAARDEMKKTEQSMRDEEARLAELLFLPEKPKKKKLVERSQNEFISGGSRTSRRRKEQQERLVKKQQEKEATEALKESQRRKKLLRVAQKSVMLWDPKRGPRKPPKESADLIFSLGELFDLPRLFQRNESPDFLLMTIGNTTRGAIERAYDWLIPIVSFVPETIARLPGSASCFLLLRAYGTEGDERKQLHELSAPLLVHVRQSLTGIFGEASCVRAFDLLLTDVASHNPDRRRCARRVLHDAIGEVANSDIPEAFLESKCSWMVTLLSLQHTKSIVGDAIKHFSRAASFERGRVLRFLILALERLAKYAEKQGISTGFSFPSLLIDLISSRPTVFAATMGSFHDLRSLAIAVVHGEFQKYSTPPEVENLNDSQRLCEVVLSCQPPGFEDNSPLKVTLPLSLLESSCVLLSIWHESSKDASGNNAVAGLVRMLMRSTATGSNSSEESLGLASAKLTASTRAAIPVESWVMLARSRSDIIAKRAALTAPNGFLPRLLLCSGLPKASLVSMVDRLGKMGDNADDIDKAFTQLLVPSATSEWDIGRLGRRKEVARKLLGRLSAYARMHDLSKLGTESLVSFTFVEWLAETCQKAEKPRRGKIKKEKSPLTHLFSSISAVEGILSGIPDNLIDSKRDPILELSGNASDMAEFVPCQKNELIYGPSSLGDMEAIGDFLQQALESNQTRSLEAWLNSMFSSGEPGSQNYERSSTVASHGSKVSHLLLKSFSNLDRKTEDLGASVVKWVPKLSAVSGSPEFWSLIMAEGQKPRFMWNNLVARCCQTWSHSHLSECRSWILSHDGDSTVDPDKMVRMLVHSSALSTTHVKSFMDNGEVHGECSWVLSSESVRKATGVAIDALLVSGNDGLLRRLRSRNSPPDACVLLLLIARVGRKHLEIVVREALERMEHATEGGREVLLAMILRVYAYAPHHMNLGVAVLRTVLKEAVETLAHDWLQWRSPMDDQFDDMIRSIMSNGSPPKIVQALAEGSKKHPLLLLRKLSIMHDLLEDDAIAHSPAAETRGVIYGHALSAPASAKIGNRLVKVTLRHWGFNFTESAWVAFLDVVAMVPKEVLFGCGLKMGLHAFLGLYLRLMSVQTQLRTSERLSKLKGNLSNFFADFKSANATAWEQWLTQETPGLSSLGSTRNVLMSCDFISHQEAIDSVRKAREKESQST